MNPLTACRRYGYEAAAAQNFVTAATWTARALVAHGFLSPDCSNLAYLAFNYCSRSTKVALFEELTRAGLQEVGTPAATFLNLCFELDLGDQDPAKMVREAFIDGILEPQIAVRSAKPILFWHIPKCSGTSLNAALGSHFYRVPVSELCPGYTYRPLVEFLVSEMLDEIPYFPSMHFGMDEIAPKADCFSFSVVRDPVKRCLSMFRQEFVVNARRPGNELDWHHYRVFPRYGAFWDYRRDKGFRQWLENIPDRLLQRQLTTFSARRDVQEAAARIGQLDYVFAREFEIGSEQGLLTKLGLGDADIEVPENLNRSDKGVEVPEEAGRLLRKRLRDEYDLIELIADRLPSTREIR